MKTIRTIYLGPTNTKGARIKITDDDGNHFTESRDYSLDYGDQADQMVKEFIKKMNWTNTPIMYSGGTKNGDYVYVFSDHPVKLED